jgi:hypothetical protein
MSSGDKRKVSTDALETLGTIIGPNEKRDAIHLAVMPVVAGTRLYPGRDVRVAEGKAWPTSRSGGIGIVDPFLDCFVEEGDHFWLVIYPRKINSLRHVWSHPDLPEEPGVEVPPPAQDKNREASEKWLREFVKNSDCPDYETVIQAAANGEGDGEYLFFGGQDAHGDIPPEFWDHVEVVTGRKIAKENRADWFSCSC